MQTIKRQNFDKNNQTRLSLFIVKGRDYP